MPATDPGPLGTFSAYAEHPAPTRLAAGSAIALVLAGAEDDAAVELDDVAADVLDDSVDDVLEQADAPRTATALRPAAATARK